MKVINCDFTLKNIYKLKLFSKFLFVLILVIFLVLSLLAISLTKVGSEKAILVYKYGNKDIRAELTTEESLQLKRIFNYKFLYKDNPACGFSEDISIIFGKDTFCIACDKCPCIKLLDEDKYFAISQNDRKNIEKIFEKYGGKFPCI